MEWVPFSASFLFPVFLGRENRDQKDEMKENDEDKGIMCAAGQVVVVFSAFLLSFLLLFTLKPIWLIDKLL